MQLKAVKEKVIEFTQSDSRKFRKDYPISDELREVMLDKVFREFMIFVLDEYYDAYTPISQEFVDEHAIPEEKKDGLIHNLFWWRIFYDANIHLKSCIEEYISENYQMLHKKPILLSWLRECDKVVPKFYYVGYKHNNRSYVVIDMLEEKPLEVIVLDPSAVPPEKGEIAMGILIPIGDSLYIPIVDFYHFNPNATQEIAMHLHYYYEKHLKTSSMYAAFLHVLSSMLQIEKILQ